MGPQEETPQQPEPERTRSFRHDPTAPEAPLLPQPLLPPPLIINAGLPSADLLPTVEPRQVEVEQEGESPSIEDLWATKSSG